MAQSPLHIKNTNDANKSFWTYEKKKIQQLLSKRKPNLFTIHGKNYSVRIEFTLWVTIRSKDAFLVQDLS